MIKKLLGWMIVNKPFETSRTMEPVGWHDSKDQSRTGYIYIYPSLDCAKRDATWDGDKIKKVEVREVCANK